MPFGPPNAVQGFARHHIIPDGTIHPVLTALGTLFNINDPRYNRMDLPTEVNAAQSQGLSRHQGQHSRYTSFVTDMLDDIGDRFLDGNDNLRADFTMEDLQREVRRLQYFLADGLVTVTVSYGDSALNYR